MHQVTPQSVSRNNLKLDLTFRGSIGRMLERMGTEAVELEIKVDGRTIQLNKFVQKIIWNILVGMLDSLREVDNWKEAIIIAKRT